MSPFSHFVPFFTSKIDTIKRGKENNKKTERNREHMEEVSYGVAA